eukprot:2385728-Pyramimonas_sp.AAC.1
MLADSPRTDPAYSLNLDPLRTLATALWEQRPPCRMLGQGLSIRGPFSACAATALRLGISFDGFSWSHPDLGCVDVSEVGLRTVSLWLEAAVERWPWREVADREGLPELQQ